MKNPDVIGLNEPWIRNQQPQKNVIKILPPQKHITKKSLFVIFLYLF